MMTRRDWLARAGLLGVAGLASTTRTPWAAELAAVRIGVVGSLFRDMPEALTRTMLSPLQQLMETQTGLAGQVTVGGEAEGLGELLTTGKYQLAVLHGFEFAWARGKFPALQPLMLAIGPHRFLRAFLVVRRDSAATDFADLRGKACGLHRFCREHCRVFLHRKVHDCGRLPCNQFFARCASPADPEEALDDVVDGEVDATVVDATAMEFYKERKPGRFNRLKVARESEPFPPGVIAYHPPSLDEATARRFRDGMLAAGRNEQGRALLRRCRISNFEEVPPGFDDSLKAIAKAYPPTAN